MTKIIEKSSEIIKYVQDARRDGAIIAFVPTMGAFHEGHLSLMRRARKDADKVIISVFVNPLQFSAGEDFDRYPRQLDLDMKLAESEQADILFVPTVAEIYPKGFATYIDQQDLPEKLCGAFRPGHFRGVMTVVAKLFNVVRPDIAYFGQKDYQQALIIRRMVTDLNFNILIKILPTIREEDGLAMSSRNVYLGPKQRKDATLIYKALKKADELIANGENSAPKVIKEMAKMIKKIKGVKIDYVSIVNQDTLEAIREIKGKTLIAVAVRVGKARLIDNIFIN
ncbi:MAG: pantoate--beta-alanine ligase [Candidatus Schekmanbacteria bacterium RBG_16_38_10]|uniref:Pantothenate synthetase n=1 Tax=Candidatus Schekmanbacteria bacterium RBG_16_38_10 TaxID=1817879 RepID=A0A1F7RPS8_9BACT|nr:MAG: pantoate--beta-alanine ligase [Candidatus Schekmanbacteria bacterium RBG_16_38_10]